MTNELLPHNLKLNLTITCNDELNIYEVNISVGQNEHFAMTNTAYYNHRNKLLEDIKTRGFQFGFIKNDFNIGETIKFKTKTDLIAFKLEFL